MTGRDNSPAGESPFAAIDKDLSDALADAMEAFLDASEAGGRSFHDAVVQATARLGGQVARAFAAFTDEAVRTRMVELFCRHLAAEVPRLHGLALAARRDGETIQ